MTNPLTSFIEYIRSSKVELEKVTWPTRELTIRYSLLVVGVSAVMAAFFAALDLGLGKGIDLALSGRTAPVQNLPVVPDLEPSNPGSPTVEGVDAEGNVVPIQITPVPLEGGEGAGGFTIGE